MAYELKSARTTQHETIEEELDSMEWGHIVNFVTVWIILHHSVMFTVVCVTNLTSDMDGEHVLNTHKNVKTWTIVARNI